MVIYPPELSAHMESFQTSERSAASGEASPICTEWRFFTRTGRRPSAAKKLGDRFCFAGVDPIGFGEDRHRRGRCAERALRQHRDCVLPRRVTREGRRKATSANRIRGVVAFAESPWPVMRTQTGLSEKSARCAILAESPWIVPRGSGPVGRRKNRSWRTN